jgi:hypothetical protein
MRGAQVGGAIDTMARQFGLTPDQVERAMQALLPAFTLGLQGSAREPDAFARTLGLMGSGRYAPFFDNPALAFSQGAMAQGNEALQALFGSKDVSSSVARGGGLRRDRPRDPEANAADPGLDPARRPSALRAGPKSAPG